MFGSLLRKAVRGVSKVSKIVPKSILKAGMKALPIVGTAYAAYDVAQEAMSAFSKPKAPALPALPAPPMGLSTSKKKRSALPAITSPRTGPTGIIPWWRGPGGGMQLPWNDPKVHQALKPYSLDDSMLRRFYRAPRGYVVVHDDKGRPYPLRQDVAKKIGWWSPAAKPPMSATEWSALKRANKVVKTLKRMNTMAKRVANFDPRRTVVVSSRKKGR